jgi:hypothetical protein
MGYHSVKVFKDTPKAGEEVSSLFSALSAWISQPIQPIELLELTKNRFSKSLRHPKWLEAGFPTPLLPVGHPDRVL